ncbi:hypothetical protein PG630_01130 [Riemerella anatipestifer]|uniref:hypothetical protein n=1 Tax=Riemerella anatipestifer TaxID=34085 RepID=UPI002A8886A8|nr:hypothetical protein [Riemerella anatipestifer]
MKSSKDLVIFYGLNVISLFLIFLSVGSVYLTDETKILDEIIVIVIILNFVLYPFLLKKDYRTEKLFIHTISIVIIFYVLLSVSYEDEMEVYFYRLLCIFTDNTIVNNHTKVSLIVHFFYFTTFILVLILEIFFLGSLVWSYIRVGNTKVK